MNDLPKKDDQVRIKGYGFPLVVGHVDRHYIYLTKGNFSLTIPLSIWDQRVDLEASLQSV